HLSLFNSPPVREMDQAERRILARLRSESILVAEPSHAAFEPVESSWKWRVLAVLAATAAIVLGLFVRVPVARNVSAVVESADGGLTRVDGGQALHPGEKLKAGDAVKTDGGIGTVLVLADGSRVEMRPRSTLSLERANDGTRIRLDA